MSKSIIEAAKQVSAVLEEMYDVTSPTVATSIWPHIESWCVMAYGQRHDGDFALSEMFNDDISTVEFVFPTLSELQDFVQRSLAINK